MFQPGFIFFINLVSFQISVKIFDIIFFFHKCASLYLNSSGASQILSTIYMHIRSVFACNEPVLYAVSICLKAKACHHREEL